MDRKPINKGVPTSGRSNKAIYFIKVVPLQKLIKRFVQVLIYAESTTTSLSGSYHFFTFLTCSLRQEMIRWVLTGSTDCEQPWNRDSGQYDVWRASEACHWHQSVFTDLNNHVEEITPVKKIGPASKSAPGQYQLFKIKITKLKNTPPKIRFSFSFLNKDGNILFRTIFKGVFLLRRQNTSSAFSTHSSQQILNLYF